MNKRALNGWELCNAKVMNEFSQKRIVNKYKEQKAVISRIVPGYCLCNMVMYVIIAFICVLIAAISRHQWVTILSV